MRRRRAPTLIACLALFVAAPAPAQAAPDSSPAPPATQPVTVLRVPDGGIQPQVATDDRGHVHLVYFAGRFEGGDVFYTRTRDGTDAFDPPVRVNSQPGSAVAVGGVRGPHLAVGRGRRAHVAWIGSRSAEPKAPPGDPAKFAPMLYARQTDPGDAFEPQRNLIAAKSGLDGGASIAADASSGAVYVVWHAPRDVTSKAYGADHEINRALWVAASRDDGRTVAPETDGGGEVPRVGVCACCAVRAMARDNRLYVLYRTARDQVHRDMALLTFAAGGDADDDADSGTLRLAGWLNIGPWQTGRCPMSTAWLVGLPSAGDERPQTAPGAAPVLAAWEQQDDVRFGTFDPRTAKASAATGPPIRNEREERVRRKHPAVARNARGETILAWAEPTGWGKGGAGAWQVFDSHGRSIPEWSGRHEDLPPWGAPAVYARRDGSFVVIY